MANCLRRRLGRKAHEQHVNVYLEVVLDSSFVMFTFPRLENRDGWETTMVPVMHQTDDPR